MNRLLHHGILLAQRSRLDELGGGLRSRRARIDPQDMVTYLLIAAGIAAAVWGISYLVKLQERRFRHASPLRLFLSLCRAHRLRWSEWWLLWRVARAGRLRDPARLFLEPEHLEAVNLGRPFQASQAQLKQIRDRLFDRLEAGQKHRGPESPSTSDQQPDATRVSPPPLSPPPDVASPGVEQPG
jgi:hypothetical protein